MSDRFPSDHPIELLRGLKRAGHAAVRRSMLRRLEWLVAKYDPTRSESGGPLLREIAAIVQVMEVFDKAVAEQSAEPQEAA